MQSRSVSTMSARCVGSHTQADCHMGQWYHSSPRIFLENLKAKKLKEKGALRPKRLEVRQWHNTWLMEVHDGVTAVAARSLLTSRAPKPTCHRVRAVGGGRHCKALLIRQELYEWWSSIRYAIDWKQVTSDNRSPLLRVHAHACILNGLPVQTFKPDNWCF